MLHQILHQLIVQLFFQLAVGAVLGGSIFLLLKSKDLLGFYIEPSLSPEGENAIWFSVLLIIIVIFGFLVIFTFLGCCGAACQNQCMLGSFIIILFIFLGGYAAGIAYLFLNFPNEIDLAANELEKTIPYYEVDGNAITSVFWDNVQPFLECCGVNGKISQCGNFMIFLSFRFYVKSRLENVKVLKLPFLQFLRLSKHTKIHQNQNSEPLNVLKWQNLHL